jgi:hypothetical protein
MEVLFLEVKIQWSVTCLNGSIGVDSRMAGFIGNRPEVAAPAACSGKFPNALYQGPEMLTHKALEMLKRRTGLTKAR